MRWIVRGFVVVSFTGCFADVPPAGDDDGSSGEDGSTAADDQSEQSDPSTDPASTDPTAEGDTSDDDVDDGATSEPDTSDGSDDDGESSTSGATTEMVVLDFAAQACSAAWHNDQGFLLPCPGNVSDMEGFVFPAGVDGVTFEDGSVVTDDALVMHPRWAAGGLVMGTYGVDAQAGDVFRATIGCVQADSACSVDLRLTDGDGQDLAPSPWSQTADGSGELVEVELPAPTTALSLQVYAGEDSGSDASLWIEPQLVRVVPR
jgi:hypothetical protein